MEEVFAKLEDLGIAHVDDQLLPLFAELITLPRLLQVLPESRVILELLNQLFDRFCAIGVLLLGCGMVYAWYSKVNVAAAGFPVTCRYALVTLWYSSSLVFMHTAFSKQIEGLVL